MKIRFLAVTLATSLAFFMAAEATPDDPPPLPTEVKGIRYDRDFFPGTHYDPAIPTPESLLGFPVGQRTASPEQIERCLKAWDEGSPRTRLIEYARTHEDRPLFYMIVTSPGNLARIDEIQTGVARLADPRDLSQQEGDRLVESLPAVAWLAYSIHGNESSGTDSALAVLYHLVASTGTEVSGLLEDLVVLIDPMMNPDGRARFIKQLAEHRGTLPNVDDQSLLHTGYWPWGRMNHYLFDLNRDWILGVHPETRGRIRAAGKWHPLLFIDAHEMGARDTYLFSPPRDPVNPHFPRELDHWVEVFARDHAAAFDRFRWPYYTGEWNEGWYPGYSNSWAGFRGAVGILYEQARISEDAVRRPEGTLLTYRESVHHQATSTMANLATLRANASRLKQDFLEGRRRAVSAQGPYANRTFAVLPSGNGSRIKDFLDLMKLQGFEIFQAEREFTAPEATDQLGRVFRRRIIPKGTILIPNRQPEAHLLATMLEFDSRIPQKTLVRERKELLRKDKSRIYDTTAWNITMLYDLEGLTLSTGLPDAATPYVPMTSPAPRPIDTRETTIAFVIDGADDRSVAAAARLMERGVQVRVADRAFTFDGRDYSRGSVLVSRNDNARFEGDLPTVVAGTAEELELVASPILSGFGEGELPELGGRHFIRLEPPRIALLARGGISPYDFGAIWHTLDHRLGVRHSHLNEKFLTNTDLRRYNLLVLPDRWFGDLADNSLKAIKKWVEGGGTLVAIGRSAGEIAREEPGFSEVRELREVLGRLEEYEIALLREWLAQLGDVPEEERIWTHVARPGLSFPWERKRLTPETKQEKLDEGKLKKRDEWQRLFMPRGVLLAARVDHEHWLTFGSSDYLPVLFSSYPVLMSAGPVQAPLRFGYLTPSGVEPTGGNPRAAHPKDGEKPLRVGWATLPEGYDLHLRMSGLLWPEAAHRLAHAAYVTREPVGKGQIILFAAPPVFRGATLGTGRILMNALIYGPGLGASHPIEP